MRKTRSSLVTSPVPDAKVTGESGFGIIESLVVLAMILIVIVSLNSYFTGTRDQISIQKARLEFEEEILRLMMITEENAVCEHLSFINQVSLQVKPGVVLRSFDSLELDGNPIIEKKRKGRFEIKSIELTQDSIYYAINPTRVRGSILVKAEFFDKFQKPIVISDEAKKSANVDIILASDTGDKISSCYGSFSRRIACRDGNGLYNPEVQPNCRY